MTTKSAVICTIAIFVATLILSVALIALFIDPRSPAATQRAGQLGQAVGIVCLLPLGAVWISWAARVRKEREQQK